METYNLTDIPDKLKLADTEISSMLKFIDNHKCPIIKRLFSRKSKNYKLVQGTDGIGLYTDIVCTRCGSKIDITDYELW